MRAVVDRIVDGTHVVLLVGEEEVETTCSREELPMGVKEGAVLDVDFVDGQLTQVKQILDSSARIEEQMKQLRKRQRSKYKRDQ